MKMKRKMMMVGLTVLVFMLTACGRGGDTAAETPDPTAQPTQPPVETLAPEPPQNNRNEIISTVWEKPAIFPYVLQAPNEAEEGLIRWSTHQNDEGGWKNYPPPWLFASADILVIEYTGAPINQYALDIFMGQPLSFYYMNSRFTKEDGRIIFHLHGLPLNDTLAHAYTSLTFRTEGANRVTRAYFDVLPPEEVPVLFPLFPYDLGLVSGYREIFEDAFYWVPQIWMAALADILVIEYEGDLIGRYEIGIDREGFYTTYRRISPGVREVMGRIELDLWSLRLDTYDVHTYFAVLFESGNLDAVTRVYFDVLPSDEANVHQGTIHVDASSAPGGNGEPGNPLRSLEAAVNMAKPGDTVIVADGVYNGVINIPQGKENHPITIKAAEGAMPYITPNIPLDAEWRVHNGNIYMADVSDEIVQQMNVAYPQLFVDGAAMIEARYPNLPGTDMSAALHQPMLLAQMGTNESNIVMPYALPYDIAGAWVVIWPGSSMLEFSVDTGRVHSVDGTEITLVHPMGGIPDPKHPYGDNTRPVPTNHFYIVGALSLLDAPGEYYFDAETQRLYFYAPNGADPNTLNLSLRSDERFAVHISSHTVLDGLYIYGGGVNARGRNITIQNCFVRYADHYYMTPYIFWEQLHGLSGLLLHGVNNTVRDSVIGPTALSGIQVIGYGNTITNNVIHDTAYGGYFNNAITAHTFNHYLEISHNSLLDCGRDLIHFLDVTGEEIYNVITEEGTLTRVSTSFVGSVVRNNHFRNPMMLCNDGGAMFLGAAYGGGAEIKYNFIEMGIGLTHGTIPKLIGGIYLEVPNHFIVRNNIVVGGRMGIQLSMPHENMQVYNNTVIGSIHGFTTGNSTFDPWHARNLILRDNLFVDIIDTDVTTLTAPWEGGERPPHLHTNFDEHGRYPLPLMERENVTMSGNTRGTIDDQFRPTGDTPDIGAIPRGGTLFPFGSTLAPRP